MVERVVLVVLGVVLLKALEQPGPVEEVLQWVTWLETFEGNANEQAGC